MFRREPVLQRGTGSQRPKTYSAESGYVYAYSFAGFRHVPGRYEYVFSVSGGREPSVRMRISLPQVEIQEWAGRDRELTASERYGIAKVCLKRILDRAETPKILPAEVTPSRDEVREVADVLDL